jgi:hypothetical protein
MTSDPRLAIDAPFEPLVRRIIEEATVVDTRILRIDHFLNHRIEPEFMAAMGRALADRLRTFAPDMVLTAEASGIAPALAVALALGVPMVYAKKYDPIVETPALSATSLPARVSRWSMISWRMGRLRGHWPRSWATQAQRSWWPASLSRSCSSMAAPRSKIWVSRSQRSHRLSG